MGPMGPLRRRRFPQEQEGYPGLEDAIFSLKGGPLGAEQDRHDPARNSSVLPGDPQYDKPKYGFDLKAELEKLGPAPQRGETPTRAPRNKYQFLADALSGLGDVATAYGGGAPRNYLERTQALESGRRDQKYRDDLMTSAMDYEKNRGAWNDRFAQMQMRKGGADQDYGRAVGERDFTRATTQDKEGGRRFDASMGFQRTQGDRANTLAREGMDLTKSRFEFEKEDKRTQRQREKELIDEMREGRKGVGGVSAASIPNDSDPEDAKKMAAQLKAQIADRQDIMPKDKLAAFAEIDNKVKMIEQKAKGKTALSWLTGGVRDLFGMPSLDQEAEREKRTEFDRINKEGKDDLDAIRKYGMGQPLTNREAEAVNRWLEKVKKGPERAQGSVWNREGLYPETEEDYTDFSTGSPTIRKRPK